MADPVSTAIIISAIAGAAVTTTGIIVQGQAAKAQAKSEQDILNFNASQKLKEAEQQRLAAQERAQKFSKKARRFRGAQRVAVSRAGVLATEGTPALLLEETAQELEADRLATLRQGFLKSEFTESEAFGLRFQGKSARARGRNIKRGSQLTAAGTLLTGFGSAALAKKQLET